MVKPTLIGKAKYLRKQQTKTESLLWDELRSNKLGVKFRRQHPIQKFVLDFYCPEIKLAIELDGSVHADKFQKDYDNIRTEFLKSENITVLRFWNSEVEKDMESVLESVKNKVKELSKHRQ